MKKIMTGLLILGVLGAQTTFATVEDLAEEQTLDRQEKEVEAIQTKTQEEFKQKQSILSKIRAARKGYKDWKKQNPNYKEIRKEFKRIAKNIKKEGTPENFALKMATERCRENQQNCASVLSSNLESIYTNSDLPALAKASGKSLSIIPSAYASGMGVKTCSDEEYFIGIFGKGTYCNINYVGPGLGYTGATERILICMGKGDGVNVGPYASLSGLIGVGAGLLVGQDGVCQLLQFNGLAVGAFAGLAIVDNF